MNSASSLMHQTRLVLLAAALSLGAGPAAPGPAAAVGPRVTLAVSGMDVLVVLKDLAEQAQLNLVASKNVTGKVTLFVKDVPLDDALDLILVANELAAERRGDLLYVMPAREYELTYGRPYRDQRIVKVLPLQYAKAAPVSTVLAQAKSTIGKVIVDEGSNTLFLVDAPEAVEQMRAMVAAMDQPTERRTVVLNYAKAKDLAPKIQEVLTKGLGAMQADDRANAVIVTDTPAKLLEIEAMLQTFDQRSRQVLIEAKIVQIALSDKFQMGVDWTSLANKFITVKGLGALNLASGGQLKLATPDMTTRGDYRVVLEALRIFGDTKILSEPRITALNGQEAKILVGSKEPYVTQSTSQAGTGTAVTAEQVTFLDVGVKLFVTPTIAQDGYVQLKIRPEVSAKTGTLTTSQKNEIPIVETSEAETTLLVQDGATLILGGLMKDEKSKDHQRIPLLGDIPILGYLFRTTKDTTKRTELLVFLTPHIVTGARGEAGE